MSDKLNLKDYENSSQLIWLVNNVKLPKGAAWDFSDRPWQIDIIEDENQYIVTRKPTQIGMSTVMLGKMLYFCDKNQIRAMYSLPRQDDVTDMVYSRLEEIIQESPYIREKMSGVDNVRMKKFGKSWIHFVEMSVPPRMMDVDFMINDEVDLSNPEHLEQIASRMDASKFGYRHQISTPTIENFGIDVLYKLSDMKEWIVQCAYCSFEQTLDWNVNVIHTKGETKYICAKCGGTLHADDIREGRWIAMGNTKSLLSGYQISHLMVPYINKEKLWIESKTMSQKNFYNFRLGLPFTPSSGSITKNVVMNNCFETRHQKEDASYSPLDKYIIGADQGNTITYAVGKLVEDRIHIVEVGEIEFSQGFDELAKIMRRFNIVKGVIDALPNHHSVSELIRKQFPHGRALEAYFPPIQDRYKIIDETKININKTDAYDNLLADIVAQKIQFYYDGFRVNEEVEKAVTHLTNMRRDIVESPNRSTGRITTHIWKNTGPDHYADAIVYMNTAAMLLRGESKSLDVIDMSDMNEWKKYKDTQEDHSNSEDFSPNSDGQILDERGFVFDLKKESTRRIDDSSILAPDNPYKLLKMLEEYYEDF